MIAIFKTDVKNKQLAERVLNALYSIWPGCCFNFDLDDCDSILRVQCKIYASEIDRIIQIVTSQSVQISLFDQVSLFEG